MSPSGAIANDLILNLPRIGPNLQETCHMASRYGNKTGYLIFLLFFLPSVTVFAAEFTVLRPSKLAIPRNIKKVFIEPERFNATNDKLEIKSEVINVLKNRLNALGRFQVKIGKPAGFDPNVETVALVQGDVISGGEIDQGQLTEKAECKGGVSGLVGAGISSQTSNQGITFSRRGMLCKQPTLEAQVVEQGLTAGLSLLGVQEFPRYDEVIRVYKYKNFSLFAQVNLSLTQIGQQRETLTIRSDAASFSRHVVNPDTYRNVRESGDNAPLIWLWFRVTPIAPVIIREIGVVRATNPDSSLGRWYNYLTPKVKDINPRERKKIVTRLVNKTVTEFIRTISPYKAVINADIASGGNPEAAKKIEAGSYEEARQILGNPSDPADLYNLGLAFEAGATTFEDYEDALNYYSLALDRNPESKLYARGIGRMEFQLRAFKKFKTQKQSHTAN